MTDLGADHRTDFEKDVDRIAYSSAFRRLSGVTQVVAVGEKMLLHNRLTHTLKVAQLSRRIALNLNRDPRNAKGLAALAAGAVNPDIAEAAGLAHDLGHPPFGHVAEHELDLLCLDKDLDGFEGNAQSFRIVTKLSRQRREGLGLSTQTLNGILKYPWLSNSSEVTDDYRKWGAYESDRRDFKTVRRGIPKGQTIEAQVMDWADDISYAVHDLEDFFRAGFISLDRLAESDPLRGEMIGRIVEANPKLDETELFETLDFLLSGLTRSPGDKPGTDAHRDAVKRMGSKLIDRFVRSSRLSTSGALEIVPEVKLEVLVLKQLTWFSVVQDPTLAAVQRGQQRLIRDLFDDLYLWCSDKTEKSRWPTRLQELVKLSKSESHPSPKAARARAVTDFIANLTEDQARDLHARMRGGALASIQDTWLAT